VTAVDSRDDTVAAENAGGPFTLQEYFTPQRKRLRRFPHLARVSFRLVWRAARRELLTIVALQAVAAAGMAGQLFLLRSLIAHLTRHLPSFAAVLPQLGGLAGITLVVGMSGVALGLRTRLLAQLVSRDATDAVVRTAIAVDLVTYEQPGFYDRLQRAQLAAATRPAAMVQELIGAGGALLSVGAIAVTLLVIQPLFCLLVVVAYIPIWFATNRAGRVGYRQTVEQTERLRMRQYLFETLTTKAPAQEVRAFGTGPFLAERQDAIYRELLDELRTVLRRRQRIALGGELLTALLAGGAIMVLVWFVTSGRMSLGAAGAAAGAMVLLSGRLHGIAGSSGGLYENSLYLEDYVNFVAAAPALEAARPTGRLDRQPSALAAEHISFTYPSRARPSLNDVSLELRRGEVVALVGENGSGKTTCAKLLAGLYTPSLGCVTWDGIDVRGLDPAELRRNVGVIFQDFTRYLLPAHDNVALGDPARFEDRGAVQEAARAAGVHDVLASLGSGYETILGPAYFGGSDLSGGQWQRVALARLFFRDAPFVILDEPAASLDPRAEAELYQSMRTLFAGRGVLLITHRFASARTADRIYVLREGRVHEQGTHSELLAAGGYYAELFELQASQYRD
jgi:ATP-binding cassette subfamily B protein